MMYKFNDKKLADPFSFCSSFSPTYTPKRKKLKSEAQWNPLKQRSANERGSLVITIVTKLTHLHQLNAKFFF